MINFLSSYLSPANLLNLPPEIDDRLFNAYPRYLPRKIDFVMLPPNAPGFVKDMAVLELKGQFEMEGVNTVVRDIA
jgi:hypothetical protein